MKLKQVQQIAPDIMELSQTFELSPSMIEKLQAGDPVRLTYMWIKQGHIDYHTFEKLLRYISES